MKSINNIVIRLVCIQFFSFCMSLCATEQKSPKVGMLVMATGKYINFVEPLVVSADKFFLLECDVSYFVFTDSQEHLARKVEIIRGREIIYIEQERLGWPKDTLMRPAIYYQHRKKLKFMDYLFAIDADMKIVDTVGNEILHPLVVVQHPGYVGRRGTYETRKESSAYVGPREGRVYCAGGFNGGKRKEYMQLCKSITHAIQEDFKKNIIACWHDESHLNRYIITHQEDVVVLTPSYCYPESKDIPFHPRIIALDKNHKEMRS